MTPKPKHCDADMIPLPTQNAWLCTTCKRLVSDMELLASTTVSK